MKHGQCARCVELAAEVAALRHAQRAPVSQEALDWAAGEVGKIEDYKAANPDWEKQTRPAREVIAQGARDSAVDPIELRANVIEVCARIADGAALRCVREQIPGDAAARFIAQNIRGLATALTPTERCDGADDLEHLDGMLDDRERG